MGEDFIKKAKLLILLLVVFSIFQFKVKANNEYYLRRVDLDNVYYVQNGLPDFYGSDIQSQLFLNDKISFCVDQGVALKAYSYSAILLDDSKYDKPIRDRLNLIMYYGYDYKDHQTRNYYLATQALIWETISNNKIEFYTQRYGNGDYINIDFERQQIESLISNHYKVPEFTQQNYSYDVTNYLEFDDDLLTDFEVYDSNWNDIEIDGNKLKINNLNNFVGNINISLKKKSYRNDEAKYYYSEYSQSLISGGKPDDVLANFSINIKGGKIKLTKIDYYSRKVIKSNKVKFNIRNYITNEYIYNNGSKDFNLNSEGYFITDFIPYGQYEIIETGTADDYQINPGPRIVKIDDETISDDGIVEIEFYNGLKKGKVEIKKIDSFSKKVLPGVEFAIYAKNDIITSDGTIHYKMDQLVKSAITNNDGIVIFDDLVCGDYYIKEISSLDGYVKNDNLYDVSINSIDMQHLVIENDLKRGNIIFEKLGEVYDFDNLNHSTKPLENVEYVLYANEDIITKDGTVHYRKNDIVMQGKTDANGYIYFNNLILGEYCVVETKTQAEYEVDSMEHCFNLYEQNFYVHTHLNNLKKGHLIIYKFDVESNNLIKNANVKFNIRNLDTGKFVYKNGKKDLSINDRGYLQLEYLPYGNYEITEISTTEDYYLNTNSIIVTIDDDNLDNNIITVDFYNELKKGSVEIKKQDSASKKVLPGVEFAIYAKNDIITSDGTIHYRKDELVKSAVTNNDGIVIFDNLIYGEYYIKETKALDGYVKNDEVYNLIINSDSLQELSIENTLDKGSITIEKQGEVYDYKKGIYSNKKLAKVEYILYAKNDIISKDGVLHYKKDEIIMRKETNTNGKIKFDNLVLGEYCILETKTLDNYLIDNQEHCFNLNDEKDISYTAINYLKKGNLKINKLDRISNKFIKNSNIKFNIKNLDKGRYVYVNGIKDLAISEDGYLLLENLPYGNYEITEISTTEDYYLNTNSIIVTIDDDNLDNNIITVDFYNELKKGSVEIKKQDSASKKVLPGVEFAIYAKNDIITSDGTIHYRKDELVKSAVTNNDGIVIFDNLIYGEYYIKETKALDGYVKNDEVYNLIINSDSLQELSIENTLDKGSITIEKQGEVYDYKKGIYSNKKLAKVEYILYAKNDIISKDGVLHYKKDEIIMRKETNTNGKIKFDNLVLGEYCILETKTLDNYLIDNQEHCFNLNGEKDVSYTAINYLKKGNLKIIKVDRDSGEPLANVKFSIYYDDILLGIYETNDLGIIEIKDLPISIYKIQEKETNIDYVLDDELLEIDLSKNTELVITNQKVVKLPNTISNNYLLYLNYAFLILFIFNEFIKKNI